eukprot:TRINITY_DN11164_c0_g1_i1.p1 TRINITY_DN11164_c0_g1~~TRINITY_DN11164_c0_g1_i1.p1  ORF type:complete len:229 (+),score=58.59 TRINITY_DN11164_c0_g1_i1:265-951(+)
MAKKAKKGKGKKKAKSKAPKIDPEKIKVEKRINDKAASRREAAIRLIAWVDVAREWFRANLAVVFDKLRSVDTAGAGTVTPTVFLEVLKSSACPLDEDQQATLSMAIDLQRNESIEYCLPAKHTKCYGGGLLEVVERGLERVMTAHRQELADIDQGHADELKLLEIGGIEAWKAGVLPDSMATAAAESGEPVAEANDSEEQPKQMSETILEESEGGADGDGDDDQDDE